MAITLYGSKQAIIQVVQTVKSDTFSTSSTSFTDVTGLSASITPSSASNKILVQVVLGSISDSADASYAILLRGSTTIAAGDGVNGVLGQIYTGGATNGDHYFGNIPITATFLDSPATTSSTTYKVQMKSASGTAYLNRNAFDASQYSGRTVSSITLYEVAYA